MTEAMLDQFSGNEIIKDNTSRISLRKKRDLPKEKHLHLVLKGDSVARLEKLQTIVHPPTQTGAVTTALQLFEAFVEEYQSGSEFYIKRESDVTPVRYEIFD